MGVEPEGALVGIDFMRETCEGVIDIFLINQNVLVHGWPCIIQGCYVYSRATSQGSEGTRRNTGVSCGGRVGRRFQLMI